MSGPCAVAGGGYVINDEQRPYFTAAARGCRLECLKVGRVLRSAAPNNAQTTLAFDVNAQGVRDSLASSLERLGRERSDVQLSRRVLGDDGEGLWHAL